MGFWDLMIKKDDFIVTSINSLYALINLFKVSQQKILNKTKNRFNNLFYNESVYIVLNGPSLKSQDLSLLKGRHTMFVNRGFKHELYKILKPTFHVFVDPKLKSGEWPISWLDEILEINPNVIFIMPIDWYNLDILQPFIKKGVTFLWMSHNNPLECLGVAGYCFDSAKFCGFKNIYFTGFDANGIAYELIKHPSHFYGINEENDTKTSTNYIVDLYMHSRHLNDLKAYSLKSKRSGFNIINLTDGGLLDMFDREKFPGSKLSNIISQ